MSLECEGQERCDSFVHLPYEDWVCMGGRAAEVSAGLLGERHSECWQNKLAYGPGIAGL